MAKMCIRDSRYLDGEPVEKYISLPSTMITRDNLHEFEIDGWQ